MDNLIHEYEPLWGSWYIESLIGEGSYGRVYKIKKTEYNKISYSVLKIISVPKNQKEIDKAFMEGIDQISVKNYFKDMADSIYPEIQWMNEIENESNIVKFEDFQVFARKDNIGFDILIRMELLKSLNSYAMEHEICISDVIKMGKDLCKALVVCKKYHKIHRDIKPENIFVTADGDYKLGDFGIARKLGDFNLGMSVNSMYEYMAPEIYMGCDYDERADIYSLGLLLYTFLNKRKPPFLTNAPMLKYDERNKAIKLRLEGKPIEALDFISERLGNVILKACSYQLEERFPSAEDFLKELESLTKLDYISREEASKFSTTQRKKEVLDARIVCLNFQSVGFAQSTNKMSVIGSNKNVSDWKQVALPYIQLEDNVVTKTISLQKKVIIVIGVAMIIISLIASDFIFFLAKDWYRDNFKMKRQNTESIVPDSK